MKKLFAILMCLVVFCCGGSFIEAKTTKKGKAKTSQSSGVSKNAYGYANPAGHTYKGTNQGVTITIKFTGASSGVISDSAGHSAPYGWYQSDATIYMGNFVFTINNNGTALTGPGGVQYKLVK